MFAICVSGQLKALAESQVESAVVLLEGLELEFRPPLFADGNGPPLATSFLRLEDLPAATPIVLDKDCLVLVRDVIDLGLREEVVLTLVAQDDPRYGGLESGKLQMSKMSSQ